MSHELENVYDENVCEKNVYDTKNCSIEYPSV